MSDVQLEEPAGQPNGGWVVLALCARCNNIMDPSEPKTHDNFYTKLQQNELGCVHKYYVHTYGQSRKWHV